MKVDLEFPAAYRPLFESHRYKVFYGGRGKGTSWNYARALLLIMAQTGKRVGCFREYQVSIKDSVHRVLADQIGLMGLEKYYDVTRDEIRCVNGGMFLFKGIRNNPTEIKSMEGLDIAWLTEAENTTTRSLEVLIPTIRSEGSEIWIDFNPDEETAPTYEKFVTAEPPPNSYIKHVTFRDNPFFPDVLKAEMEWDRAHDIDKYNHVWEGECRTVTNAQVFAGRWTVREFETPEDAQFYPGCDWGFATDPSALVRPFVQGNTLYIDYEAYGLGVDIDDLPELFDHVPDIRKWYITGDSARPDTISYIKKHGFKIRGSIKSKGSVEDGIEFIKSFDGIVIHPRCKHTIDEFKFYSYKLDRLTGEPTPVLGEKDNHCIDSLRYGLQKLMKAKSKPRFVSVEGI